MSTDEAWEQWGQRDPYFAVQTAEKFRRENLTPEAKREFFETGKRDFWHIVNTCCLRLDFSYPWPRRVLEFGCGVGRLLIPAARMVSSVEVVGADVSASMLKEARKNCYEHGIGNVSLIQATDSLLGVEGLFDLVIVFTVFQHIPPDHGVRIFGKLLNHTKPGAFGVFHFTYYRNQMWKKDLARKGDPEMRMYHYDLNHVIKMLQEEGVKDFHTEFTDHGGEWGVVLYFRKP